MTRSKPSPKKLNAADELGTLFDRFRRQAGWKLDDEETPEAKFDRKQFITAGLEILGAARVPVAYYERLYRRAMVARARKRAEGASVNYLLSAEDLAVEWFVLERELAELPQEKEDLLSENCPARENHINGESICEYLFGGKVPAILPCGDCRPKAFHERHQEFLTRHNESFASRRLESGDSESVKRAEKAEDNKPPEYRDLKNPIEILNRAKDSLAADMVKKIGTSDYDVLRDRWKSLVNALAYVYESQT